MRITYLLLKQYKRLMLSNIQHFEYRPKQNMQLLIGSNGSGKSSVMEQLTPLPAHHSQFVKGGAKEIRISHRTSRYVLVSNYDGGTGTHSFLKDDLELNTGGTFAVQRELVEREFGITKEIHDLLVGITPFSSLSTVKRREWLTRMAPVDLDYAFKVYTHAKTTHRDQQGVVKHLTKRMGLENHDLPDDAELSRYRTQIDTLTQKLDRLFQTRQANAQSPFTHTQALKDELAALTRQGHALLYRHPEKLPEGVTDRASFLNELETRQELKQRLASRLDRMTEEHHRLLSDAPNKDERLTETQIAALRHTHAELKPRFDALLKKAKTTQVEFPLVELPPDRQPAAALANVMDAWLELMQSFPNNSDGRFSRKTGADTQTEHQHLDQQIQHLERTQSADAAKLARMRACDTVVCPSCEHGFKPGINPTDVTALETQLSQRGTAIEQARARLAVLSEYLETYTDYLTYVRSFQKVVIENPSFKPLWDYCIEHRVMLQAPKDYVNRALAWQSAMTQRIELKQTQQDLDVVEHQLRYVDAIDQNALTQLDQQRKRLEAEIETTTAQLRAASKALTELHRLRTQRDEYLNNITDVADRLTRFYAKADQHRDSMYQDAVMQETQTTQLQLAQTQELMSKAQLREGVLNDIQTQHTQAVDAQKELQLIARALGPTDGLIGTYLMGFMQMVVELVNAVISEVWTYPMEVRPSPMEKDELTYKFPLDVNKGAVTAPDIQLGSSSQRDIVNFAFKLVVMKFLKLHNMPLYLDEFGSTFDEQHRQNLIPFVNRMLELGQVEQIFFISHFNSTHGAFNQAEVCVLDPTNITVPKTYNQHVTLG